MSAGGWASLEGWLGVGEVVLVVVALVLLLRARRAAAGRRLVVAALVLAAVLGVTVAQPLGVTRSEISAEEFAAGAPGRIDERDVQHMEVLGLPVLAFALHPREAFAPGVEDGDLSWLTVRSWVPPGLFVNGTKVMEMCLSGTACWDPDADDDVLSSRTTLELVEADGEWRVALRERYRGGPGETAETAQYVKLGVGLTSPAGLAYWVLAGALMVVVVRRHAPWRR